MGVEKAPYGVDETRDMRLVSENVGGAKKGLLPKEFLMCSSRLEKLRCEIFHEVEGHLTERRLFQSVLACNF